MKKFTKQQTLDMLCKALRQRKMEEYYISVYGLAFKEHDTTFLQQLQHAHDGYGVDFNRLDDKLRGLANYHKLKYTTILNSKIGKL